jgi:DNA helicase II / ATP-dependent DNA helicase PcrA
VTDPRHDGEVQGGDVTAPPDDPDATPVHWFEHDGEWWVVGGSERRVVDDRAAAFAEARELARRLTPSRLVSRRPEEWEAAPVRADHAVDAVPASGPSGSDVQGAEGPSDDGRGDDSVQPSEAPSTAVPFDVVPGDGLGVATGAAPSRRASRERDHRPFHAFAGPDALGRSLLVDDVGAVPAAWSDCARVLVTADALGSEELLGTVRGAFLERTRVVYVLDPDVMPPPSEREDGDVWRVPVTHEFRRDATWSLLRANAVDARSASPWPWATRAVELGATPGGPADVTLSDGRRAWCDGGPLRLWDADLGAEGVVVPREALVGGRLQCVAAAVVGSDLAQDQLDAVGEPAMRARIIAPAGSGKTRVLTERARHLLRSGVPGDAVTLVAFNKRAQLEMVERTADLPGLEVRTLNALALAIVNGTGGFASRRERVTTIDEVQVRDLLAGLVRFPRRANTDPAAPWIEALSRVRLGLKEPRAVEREFDGDVDGFAETFPTYRDLLSRRGVVDFDEQVYRCLELLLREPDVRVAAQRRCQLLLVDEFQDLTPAHMLLLRLLAGPNLSIFGVGDDDQTIYGYSGATPRWLVDFGDFVPAPRFHSLDVNYRCPERVVVAATNLLSRNRQRVDKVIRAGPTNDRSPEAVRVVADERPEMVTATIVRGHVDGGARPADVAVLARVNSTLVPVQAALVEAGIPVQLRDAGDFLQRTGVAAALAWLRVAVAPDRLARSDLMLAARRPSRGISPRVIEWVGEQSDVDGIERLGGRITDARTADKVLAFAGDVRRIAARATAASTAELLAYARSDLGLERAVSTLDDAHVGRNRQAHSDDLRALTALGRLHEDASTFTAWLKRTLGVANDPDGVVLATVHRVKGLEWPHVVVHDASSGLFPHRLSTDVEEERRVFHVAITRTRATLHLVADAAAPSLFLDELDEPADLSATTEAITVEDPAAIEAVVGLTFRWGGYDCEAVEVGSRDVVATVGGTRLTIPFGSDVVVAGRLRRLAAPRPTRAVVVAPSGPAEAAAFDALKAWRRERSQRDKVPAYVVASDRTLESIATAMPTDERSLLAVHGIGATKVELYGDEILAILDAHRVSA